MWDHEFVRNLIQERLLNERLSARLIGIATGGRDAVINGWVAPPPRLTEEADAGENSDDSPIASAADTKGEVHGAAGTSEEIELTNDDASAEPLSAGAAPADTAG
jgi:hypothetical protein